MKTWKLLQSTAVAVACCGSALPQAALAAGGAQPSQTQAVAPTAVVADVALSADGLLRGQVVNGQGQPLASVPVSVRANSGEIVSAVTDKNGFFAVGGLRGGSYTVVAGQGYGAFRLWTAQTAPPVAKPGLLVVSSKEIVRGAPSSTTTGIIVLGTVGGIVGYGVATQHGENNHNNNQAQGASN